MSVCVYMWSWAMYVNLLLDYTVHVYTTVVGH